MASLDIPVTIRDDRLFQHCTIVVTIIETRKTRLRRWLAKVLIFLAAVILGCGIKFIPHEPELPQE